MTIKKVSLAEKFERFQETWSPKIVGELNEPNEFLIVPHGVEHKPVAVSGTNLLLLEPKTTVNTGTTGGERTAEPVWI